ncbi:MAG: histidine--tRNA ligase [Fidelibacterota bacterium]
MNQIRTLKGTHDILPSDSQKWQRLEQIVHKVSQRFGYEEIRTPIFEETRLFSRSVGEDTDIVSKEMYSWEDKNGTSITLRPELTASVVRSYIQHNLGGQAPVQRLYYMGPLFRRERPQKGRQRQFHQFGVEAFGSENPEQDAEIIAIAWHILSECGLSENATLRLNSIGSPLCRTAYREAFTDFIRPNLAQFSETSQTRFETNPLRILDTKAEHEQKLLEGAPIVSDCFTEEDKVHFESVQRFLNAMNIPFLIDEKLVRGLDYYSRTVFEFTSTKLGAQDALLGGGRYDKLVETLGGKPTPGIGFASGMERFLIAMGDQTIESKMDIYFVCLDEAGLSTALSLSNELRHAGFSVISDPLRRSLKAQMREANKSGARYAIILGETEMETDSVVLKNLEKGEQETVSQKNIKEKLKNLTI